MRIQSNTSKIVIAVVVTVAVVCSGVYYWQTQNSTKNIDDYLNTYENSPIQLQANNLINAFSLCIDQYAPPITSEMCDRTLSLFSDAGWDDGENHEFYFELDESGATYFGPFKDNTLRLKEEASQKQNFVVR
jgi:hypothetical protein